MKKIKLDFNIVTGKYRTFYLMLFWLVIVTLLRKATEGFELVAGVLLFSYVVVQLIHEPFKVKK